MNRDDQLADLLVAWDDAIAAGRPVTPQDLCRDHPDLLGPFLDLLRAVGHIDRVFDGPPTDPQQFVERFDAGRYKPRTFHAAGGLGMVAIAEDQELKRSVALKVMQQLAALDPAARRRFLLEAEITGKLEHPGVAPVYGAGENPDGLPYYAMRFIQGKTLADHIREHHAATDPTAKRLDFARLLRCLASVCQTVAYAHARGVLHRDIKPGNVMLGPYGETLLVDWGLAKQFNLPDPTGSVPIGFKPVEVKPSGETIGGGQTVAGQVKGSPAFMAPEQARGEWDRVGPAADIYALGATLYVLLTGELPYTGDSTEQIIQAVKDGPPRPVLAMNSSAPKPLAAVCAKAMARTPNERYASAQELAADVERWLADEPVSVYRDPLFTRLRRWMKRHRTLAAAAAAGLLVLTAALAVVAPILTAKNQELGKLNGDLSKVNTDLTDANTKLTASASAARANFDEADGTAQGLMAMVFARATLEPGPRARLFRTEAVRRYRDYLTRFIDRNRDRPEVRQEAGLAWLKVAEFEGLLDRRIEPVLAACGEAERIFADLKQENPNNQEAEYGWASALVLRAEALADRGRAGEALPLLEKAIPAFERLTADPHPLRITGRFDTPGILDASPQFRLATSTALLSEVVKRTDAAKQTALPGGDKPSDRPRQLLRDALRHLTGDRPLPADAPLFTLLKWFALRVQLAESDPDIAAKEKALEELAGELKPLAGRDGMIEYRALALQVDFALGQCQTSRAIQEHADALARKDAAGATRADAKLNDGLERLTAAWDAVPDLLQADLGLDPLGLRPQLLTMKFEVRYTQFVAVSQRSSRSIGFRDRQQHDSWFYQYDAVVHLKILTDQKKLPTPAAARAVMLVADFAPFLAATGYYGSCEQAYTHGVTLLDRLLAEAPHEQGLLILKAVFLNGAAGIKMSKGQTADGQKDIAAAEELLANYPREKGDWAPVIVETQLLLLRAGAALRLGPGNAAEAVKVSELLPKKVDELKKAGAPAECVDGMRLLADFTLATALALQAGEYLTGPNKDLDQARQILARALPLARDLKARKIRADNNPLMNAMLETVNPKIDQLITNLEKFDSLANPKK